MGLSQTLQMAPGRKPVGFCCVSGKIASIASNCNQRMAFSQLPIRFIE
jgi:hypothetical protein